MELPKGIELIRTGYACPEQYDVLLNGEQIGYIRYRHGEFRVDYPDVCGETLMFEILDPTKESDYGAGILTDEQRDSLLPQALETLLNRHNATEKSKWPYKHISYQYIKDCLPMYETFIQMHQMQIDEWKIEGKSYDAQHDIHLDHMKISLETYKYLVRKYEAN